MWPKKISIALSAASLAALSALALAVPTEAARQGGERIRIHDDCNAASFNTAFGAGVCSGDGRTSAGDFLAELAATQAAAAWNFDPSMLAIRGGRPVLLDNRGGETHTFTLVKKFGGGFIDGLNQLSGNPDPAHECVSGKLPDGTLVPVPPSPVNVYVSAGTKEAFDTAHLRPGTYMFECCIHPWMRVVLTVK